MKCQTPTGAVLVALLAAGWAFGGEPPGSEPRPITSVGAWCPDPVVALSGDRAATGGIACCLRQLGPAGGWDPYGGGLLHWWPRHCFPQCGGPDDYCRKPLPPVCWPPYPPYFIWAPSEACHCPGRCGPATREVP
jgi:hypothetical protein